MRCALLVLSALAVATNAVTITVWTTSGCTGSPVLTASGSVGSCIASQENGASVKATSCSGGTFSGTYWSGSTTCPANSGASVTDQATDSCFNLDSGLYAKVNCGGCFSSKASVVVKGGETVPFSNLTVGDYVQSTTEDGTLFYDKVFRVTHFEEKTRASFIELTTSNGQRLELTHGHMLHSGSCCDLEKLVTADSIKVGDKIFVVGQDNKLVATQVTAAREVYSQGLFNVHTLGGNIVVNGVVASHFTDQTTWDEVSRSKAPYWYRLVDMANSIVGAENAKDNLRH